MSRYVYKKPVRRSRYADSRRFSLMAIILIVLVGGIGFFIYFGAHSKTVKPVSSVQTSEITDNKETFKSPSFQFQDTGKWVLDEKDSNQNKFIYLKYRGQVLEHQLIVYV